MNCIKFLVQCLVVATGFSLFSCKENTSDDRKNETSLQLEANFATFFQESIPHISPVIGTQGDTTEVWAAHVYSETAEAKQQSALQRHPISEPNKVVAIHTFENETIVGLASLPNERVAVATFKARSTDGYPNSELFLYVLNGQGNIEKSVSYAEVNKRPSDFCNLSQASDRDIDGFFSHTSVSLKSFENSLMLAAYECGKVRVLRLNENLESQWAVTSTAARRDAMMFYANVDVAAFSSYVYVTTNVPKEAASKIANDLKVVAYGAQDILVQKISITDGKIISQLLLGTANSERPSQLVIASDKTLFVVGETTVERPTAAKSTQSDTFVALVETENLSEVWNKSFDFMNEENVTTATRVENGDLLIGGNSDFLQVPTGSVTTYSQAFLAHVSARGALQDIYKFGSARADSVLSLVNLPGGRVLASGIQNAPITHDGDSDKKQLFFNAFLKVFDL